MAVETYDQPLAGKRLAEVVEDATTVLAQTAVQFAPHEQTMPNMTVAVDAGRLFDTSTKTVTEVAAQSTATVAAPAANPRNDIVYVDLTTGAVGVTTGAEAPSPVDPAVPDDKAPVARIHLTTSTTTITNDDIDDLRVLTGANTGAGGGTTTVVTGLENVILNRLEIAQQHSLTAGNLVDGMFDAFTDELGVDTATSSNEYHDGSSFSFTNYPPGIFGSDLTTQGGAIASSELAGSFQKERAFDDNDVTRWAHDGINEPVDATGQYIGQDFGIGNAPNVRRVSFSQHTPTSNYISGLNSIAVDYSDNGSAWTQADTVSPIANGLLQNFDIANGGTHRWWRIRALQDTADPNAAWSVFELQMNEPSPTSDLTLLSNAFTAQVQPDSVDIAILWDEIDPATLNTDILVDVSRDGGTTFTLGTLANRGNYSPAREILTATVDVSGQPAGTSMKWRIRTANLKSQRFHGVGLTWS